MVRAALLLTTFALPVLAAPTLGGSPAWATDRPGCAVGAHASRYAIKADVNGARMDAAAALAIYDARTGAVPDRRLGTFFLEFTDGAGARLGGARAIQFEPWGWTESRSDAGLTAAISVLALEHDVFGISVRLDGVVSPLTVKATLEGILTGGSATVSTGSGAVPAIVTVDSGEGRPFGVGVAIGDSSAVVTGSSGATYAATASTVVSANSTVAFALVFHDDASQVATLGSSALQRPVTAWETDADAAWDTFKSAFAPPHTTDAALLAADDRALAVLWNNELGTAADAVLGVVPAKTHSNLFEVRDTGFAALAAVDHSPQKAIAYLDGALRGQLTDPDGLIPRQLREDGTAPNTNRYSEIPAFAWALRALQDRAITPVASPELGRLLDAEIRLLGWWRAHRDWDDDLVPEVNGAWEAGQDLAPRFTEVWGTGDGVRSPVVETAPPPRVPLNAVDLSSALHLEYVEASRLASVLGREDEGREFLARGSLLAQQIDEATYGHWDDGIGAYFDYILVGTDRARELSTHRTPAMITPLTAGAARELGRVRRVIAHLNSAAELSLAHGVASLSGSDPDFSAGVPWRGAAIAEHQWDAAVALYRYGFETEAEAAKLRYLSAVAATTDLPETLNAETGVRGAAGCYETTAAVFVELVRNRHQAETLAVQRADLPKQREGEFRRILRPSDGQILYVVDVAGSREIPVTRLSSETQLFSGEPMTLELVDPHGLIGAADVQLSFPQFVEVHARWLAGAGEERTLKSGSTGAGIAFTAHVGDRIQLDGVHFLGERPCGCGASGAEGPLVLAVLALWRRRRRSQSPVGPRARGV